MVSSSGSSNSRVPPSVYILSNVVPTHMLWKKRGHTATIFAELGVGGPSWLAHTRGLGELSPPSRVTASLCAAIQLGSTGTRGGLQFCAADEPDASSSAEVNHRYTTGVSVRQHNTAALLTLGLLKRTGRGTFFKNKAGKKTHITLKYPLAGKKKTKN